MVTLTIIFNLIFLILFIEWADRRDLNWLGYVAGGILFYGVGGLIGAGLIYDVHGVNYFETSGSTYDTLFFFLTSLGVLGSFAITALLSGIFEGSNNPQISARPRLGTLLEVVGLVSSVLGIVGFYLDYF